MTGARPSPSPSPLGEKGTQREERSQRRSAEHEDRGAGAPGGFRAAWPGARPARRALGRGAEAGAARGRGRAGHARRREHHAPEAHGRRGLRARPREVPRRGQAHLRHLCRAHPPGPRGDEPGAVLPGPHRHHGRAQRVRPAEGVVRDRAQRRPRAGPGRDQGRLHPRPAHSPPRAGGDPARRAPRRVRDGASGTGPGRRLPSRADRRPGRPPVLRPHARGRSLRQRFRGRRCPCPPVRSP